MAYSVNVRPDIGLLHKLADQLIDQLTKAGHAPEPFLLTHDEIDAWRNQFDGIPIPVGMLCFRGIQIKEAPTYESERGMEQIVNPLPTQIECPVRTFTDQIIEDIFKKEFGHDPSRFEWTPEAFATREAIKDLTYGSEACQHEWVGDGVPYGGKVCRLCKASD